MRFLAMLLVGTVLLSLGILFPVPDRGTVEAAEPIAFPKFKMQEIDAALKIGFVVGAGWKPSDTLTPGTLQWLKNPGVADKEWAMYPIPCDEPTVHRVRAFDIDGDGKPEIVMVPLQGRGATAKGNFVDGKP